MSNWMKITVLVPDEDEAVYSDAIFLYINKALDKDIGWRNVIDVRTDMAPCEAPE